ncbi:UNVERIFIED_CONTAM: hypothetical protein HHA_449780 [Hammondia hammondi]|eukprot:XP_008882471.1 hypothetical protein HHA_449780 [Hammondia hammondi]
MGEQSTAPPYSPLFPSTGDSSRVTLRRKECLAVGPGDARELDEVLYPERGATGDKRAAEPLGVFNSILLSNDAGPQGVEDERAVTLHADTE